MNNFSQDIYRLLTQFRQAFKHKWPSTLTQGFPERDIKLKRSELKVLNDLGLYETALYLSNLLKTHISANPIHHQIHSDMKNFSKTLDTFLAEYTLDTYKIIHKKQNAAHAHVQAIQLINLPKKDLNETVSKQLRAYTQRVAMHGSQNQIKHLLDCMKKNQHKNNYFFIVQMSHFQSALESKNKSTHHMIKTHE